MTTEGGLMFAEFHERDRLIVSTRKHDFSFVWFLIEQVLLFENIL